MAAILDIAALEAACRKYPAFDLLATPRRVTFHDYTGAYYDREHVPLYALASELQYFMVKDGVQLVTWWPVVNILAAYMLYNIRTGRVWDADSMAEATAYIQQWSVGNYNFSSGQIENTLNVFSFHRKEIQFGDYLFNPRSVNGAAGAASAATSGGGKGILMAAGAALALVALSSKKGKR